MEQVKGHLSLWGTSVISLGNLEYVGENLELQHTLIINLGKLKHVGRHLLLRDTLISKMTYEQKQEIVKNVEVNGTIDYD